MDLQQRFTAAHLLANASAPAAHLASTAGEWDPPVGVVPERDLLPFSIGIPDSASLPRDAIIDAMLRVLQHNDDAAFRYGLGPGYFPLREWLTQHYSHERSYAMDPDWFQITNGSSGAIDLIVRSLIQPGDVIIAEAPTYMGTLHNFRGVLADVHTLPMDEHGLQVGAIGELVAQARLQGKRVKLVYTISAFHNPTGLTLSHARREQLLALAAEHGFYVLDDEAYRELYFSHPPPAPISEIAQGYGVITVGSFSKILATGLRVGWIHARPELLGLFRRMRFAMGQNQIGLRMLANLLADGVLEPHMLAMRDLYRDKMRLTSAALRHYAPTHLSFHEPEGGFYLWAQLASGLSAKNVWRAAYREGVSLNAGAGFYPDKVEPRPEHLRIAYPWIATDAIDEAAQRLARACDRVAAGDLA